jgi:hypothetical protein
MVSSEDIMTMQRRYQADRGSRKRNATSASVEGGEVIDQIVDCAAGGDFLDQTIAVWQRYADRPLTREDAREITHNVVGFFSILREWAEEERRAAALAEPSPSPAQFSDGEAKEK